MIEKIEKFLLKETSPLEEQELNELLKDKDSLSEFVKAKKEFDIIDNSIRNIDIQSAKLSIDEQISQKEKSRYIKKLSRNIMKVAAILLVGFVSFYFVFLFNTNKIAEQQCIATGKGERTSVLLSDGSIVKLAPCSKITFDNDFNKKNRSVRIEGEAFFEVKRNTEKNFIVNAKEIEITVTGTKFNVNAYSDNNSVETSLIEGSINLKTKKQEIKVIPGQKIIYSKSNEDLTISKYEECDLLWKSNIISFKNEKFEAIIKKLQRNFDVKIVLQNETLKSNSYTGKFSGITITEALNNLKIITPFAYKQENNVIYIQ